MVGGGIRVSIPASTRKMIHSIKEITAGNYSEDEILAMLHECDMDPDEAAQRLLLQDPFHEVKKKRDKRKENLSNKDSAETRWRSSGQGRGNRGARVNFSSRHPTHDASSAKNSLKKENGSKQVTDPFISPTQEIKNKETASSSSAILDNGSAGLPLQGSNVQHASHIPADLDQPKAMEPSVLTNKLDNAPPSVELTKNQGLTFGPGHLPTEDKKVDSLPLPRPSSSEVQFSSSGPKLGSEQTIQEQHTGEHKYLGRSRGAGKAGLSDPHYSRPTSAHSNSTGSRPSSNYSNRSQQTVGHHRAGSVKEWKPKSVNLNPVQGSGASSASEVPAVSAEPSEKTSVQVLPSTEATSKLQKQLEDLHIRQNQHVIIPNHILVPEAERTKLSFGSFDAGFSLTSNNVAGPENEKSSTPLSENSHDDEGSLEDDAFSNQNTSVVEKEGDSYDNSEAPSQVQDDLAGNGVISASSIAEYNDPKQESTLESENHQSSSVNAQNHGIGLLPPALGSQLPQFENTDPQARDALRIPSFVFQPPFDPASYYAQFYRPTSDSDGRLSPFFTPGVATKFNGGVTVLPPQSTQSLQEGGSTLVLPTASPTPLVTQAAGLMQSSIPVTQQPLPVFRPPGMHVAPYPLNYMPYYYSPFYVPPPAVHQFLSNGAFQQQPQASGVYPAPPPGASTGSKYSLPQYKTGTNTGSLTHVGMPSGYGPYGSFPAGYTPNSAASSGNSTANEDLNSSQLKDTNGYTTGQQSEALPVWVTGGRDVSNLPVNSFYNLQHQDQHVTYAPTQAGHITFPGMYHPTQAVTAATVHHPLLQQSQAVARPDMVAPGLNVFQQPQQTQMNWPSNY
ncbi:PREDICTED: GBF-interacting protein 1-like isoform X2 [Tarenaya hassleriana]|uniref:GBF-interacting protein 1-like isoform X2 n=1 Tax=Tarenaya hassleriana TaxID=28532 RepID=UPI00053C72DA|nr:PREDICTED: GBF-interacting protein 1-like isoform X2 [Tarenaya hassleriana]